MATGVSQGANGQYQYSGLGRCVCLRDTLGWGCRSGDCGVDDGAEAKGRASKGSADEDGRKKRRGRAS